MDAEAPRRLQASRGAYRGLKATLRFQDNDFALWLGAQWVTPSTRQREAPPPSRFDDAQAVSCEGSKESVLGVKGIAIC